MTRLTDWELVARAAQGQAAAFAELVRRYHVPVIHFCHRMTGSREDAEDLAQECFMRVHRYLPQLRPEAQFTTALFSIARNLTLNFLRDSGRRGRGHFEPVTSAARQKSVADSPDVRARKNEINEFVARAIGELAPDHREVLLLRELQGMDYDTIAGVVQCPRGTVKSRIARAREQLRIRLSEAGVLDL